PTTTTGAAPTTAASTQTTTAHIVSPLSPLPLQETPEPLFSTTTKNSDTHSTSLLPPTSLPLPVSSPSPSFATVLPLPSHEHRPNKLRRVETAQDATVEELLAEFSKSSNSSSNGHLVHESFRAPDRMAQWLLQFQPLEVLDLPR